MSQNGGPSGHLQRVKTSDHLRLTLSPSNGPIYVMKAHFTSQAHHNLGNLNTTRKPRSHNHPPNLGRPTPHGAAQRGVHRACHTKSKSAKAGSNLRSWHEPYISSFVLSVAFSLWIGLEGNSQETVLRSTLLLWLLYVYLVV